MLYRILRPALFLLPAEATHQLALAAAHLLPPRAPVGSAVELLGLTFANRVGLAAGCDKNATALSALGRLGFGCIEVGTVTPRAQAGQPAPRLFRLPRSGALVNRMGFPNDGAEAVAARVAARRYGGVVGINIGKNADTPLTRAVDDYVAAFRVVAPVADYVAVNVSSPNTLGLRELQAPTQLEPLLAALKSEQQGLRLRSGRRVPLLLKLSPDLEAAELARLAKLVRELQFDGVIATNSTVSREGSAEDAAAAEVGGLSGRPLQARARQTVRALRELLGSDPVIIGVGGVDTPASALALREAGADLVQLYTGLVFQGPGLVRRLARALAPAAPNP